MAEQFDTRIQDIKFRIEKTKNKKAEATAKLELLRQQYGQKVKELNSLGILDLSNLPKLIEDKSKELKDLIDSVDAQLKVVESQIQ